MLAQSLADHNLTSPVLIGVLIFIYVAPMVLDIFFSGDKS